MENTDSATDSYSQKACMIETIKKNILSGNFLEAAKYLPEISAKEFEKIIFYIGLNLENIIAYSFLCFLMIKNETIELHTSAFQIIIGEFFYIDGSYATALYHARRIIELDPNNLESIHALLFFNSHPEKLVSNEEALEITTFLNSKGFRS